MDQWMPRPKQSRFTAGQKPPGPRRVLLVLDNSAYGMGVGKGIARYAKEHEFWSFFVRGTHEPDFSILGNWKLDGIICHVDTPAMQAIVEHSGVPAVSVSGERLTPSAPIVACDNVQVGQLAAKHLLERGFRRFAYCGTDGWDFSRDRGNGFEETVKAAGHQLVHYARSPQLSMQWTWDRQLTDLARWLSKLQPPVAVFAADDRQGRQVIEACHRVDLRVPEDVAVVGVDNDELMCELCQPSLSTVLQPLEAIGYEAAGVLDKLMQGLGKPKQPMLIPPLRVLARQSSDVLAIEDEHVAEAVRFIRSSADKPIDVEDVMERLTISRRSLERRFMKHLGRSPRAEIRRVHIDHAKALLAQGKIDMHTAAQRSGFSSASVFAVVFKRETGMTPSEYSRSLRDEPTIQ